MSVHSKRALAATEPPLVSVVIPTHNRADLLREALDSVYRQEGCGEVFEIEVVVTDDASTDDTPGLIRAYSSVRFLRHATNRGPSAARNTAIRASSGKYVAFLDDDDRWYPHRLRVQVPFLEAHGDFGAVYGQNELNGDGIDEVFPNAGLAPSGNVFRAFVMNDVIAIGSLLVRRDAFEKAGYFDETITMPSMEHYDMCVRLAFHVPFQFIPGPVYFHRFWKQGGWLRSVVDGRYERDLCYGVEKALALLPRTKEQDALRREARNQAYWSIVGNLCEFAKTDQRVAHARALTQVYLRESSVARNVRGLVDWRQNAWRAAIPSWRTLSIEIRVAAVKRRLRRWSIRRLLADVWMQAAIMLQEGGNLLASVYASARSALYNPYPIASSALIALFHLLFRE